MANFYLHWEVHLLSALRCLVHSNVTAFCRMLAEATATLNNTRKCLLFQIELQLIGGTIVESPTRQEIKKQLDTFISNIVDAPQKFPRWIRGTCERFPAGAD